MIQMTIEQALEFSDLNQKYAFLMDYERTCSSRTQLDLIYAAKEAIIDREVRLTKEIEAS